mgnify:FL=1|tara:strand:- start:2610 stop:3725 length:1116 start_codon:yes stop_codon:yes gene_type:complete
MFKNILFFISILLLGACSIDEGNISGIITNAEDGQWIFLEKLTLNDIEKVDSCQIKNESFSFNYKSDSINFYRISESEKNYGLIAIQNTDTIVFKADISSLVNFRASGSKEVEANTQLIEIINSIKPKIDSLKTTYQKSVSTVEESIVLERIRKRYDSIILQQKEEFKRFIDENPNLFINLITLQQLGDVAEYFNYYKKVSSNLDSLYPNNFWVNDIKEKVLSEKNTAIGAQAPNFKINDSQDKPFELSTLKGSYVLLDFWASWCMPCRRENPLIVNLYKKYRLMGLEIVGISLDDTTNSMDAKADWLKAINQDGLEWKQVSQLKGFESSVCIDYGITSIPSTFLLDENGIIIARNLRGTILANKLKEIFE